MIRTFLVALRAVERALASGLLAVIVALVVMASAGRYFGSPVIWAIEVTQALFVWLCVLAADLTLQRAGHFSVDIFASLLPPRARKALDIFNILLGGALLAVLAWFGFVFASFTSTRPLPMTGITSGVATVALAVGFVLMLVTLAEQLIDRLRGRTVSDADEPREVM